MERELVALAVICVLCVTEASRPHLVPSNPSCPELVRAKLLIGLDFSLLLSVSLLVTLPSLRPRIQGWARGPDKGVQSSEEAETGGDNASCVL